MMLSWSDGILEANEASFSPPETIDVERPDTKQSKPTETATPFATPSRSSSNPFFDGFKTTVLNEQFSILNVFQFGFLCFCLGSVAYMAFSSLIGPCLSSPDMKLSIMTWNILAPKSTYEQTAGNANSRDVASNMRKFCGIDMGCLETRFRRPLIAKTILECGADIVALQEVQRSELIFLEQELSGVYQLGFFAKHTILDEWKNRNDWAANCCVIDVGNAFFVKRKVLDNCTHHRFEAVDLDDGEAAIVMFLRDSHGQKTAIVNLDMEPTDNEYEDVCGLRKMNNIEDFLAENRVDQTIFVGDMNHTPQMFLDMNPSEHRDIGMVFGHLEPTSWTEHGPLRVDYIMTELETTEFRPLISVVRSGELEPGCDSMRTQWHEGVLRKCGSDHIPLYCELSLKKRH